MGVKWHKLGEFIESYSKRCGDAEATVAYICS